MEVTVNNEEMNDYLLDSMFTTHNVNVMSKQAIHNITPISESTASNVSRTPDALSDNSSGNTSSEVDVHKRITFSDVTTVTYIYRLEEFADVFYERGNWGCQVQCLVTCLGYAVHPDNIWQFPVFVSRNGGGASLIPYTVSLLVLGVPLYFLETYLGQVASQGPVSVWDVNPLLKGLGYSMLVLGASLSIHMSVLTATASYYVFLSITDPLPWSTCDNPWNTCRCRSHSTQNPELIQIRRFCTTNSTTTTTTSSSSTPTTTASDEFFRLNVMEGRSFLLGELNMSLIACNMVVWGVVCCVLVSGTKGLGRITAGLTTAFYLILVVLLINLLTLPGAGAGVTFYLASDFSHLASADVWLQAAAQTLLTIGCSTGTLIGMSSYSDFNSPLMVHSFAVPAASCLTSLLAGLLIFCSLGYLSELLDDRPLRELDTTGFDFYFFKLLPEALAFLPLANMWSIVLFLMLICISLTTHCPNWRCLTAALEEEFPDIKGSLFKIASCGVGFVISMPATSERFWHIFDRSAFFTMFPIAMFAFMELVAILWIYGFARFSEDVVLMVGEGRWTTRGLHLYYSWTLAGAAPLILLVMLAAAGMYNTGSSYVASWVLVALVIAMAPGWLLGKLCLEGYRNFREDPHNQESFKEILIRLSSPTLSWGPALWENRTIPRYMASVGTLRDGIDSLGKLTEAP